MANHDWNDMNNDGNAGLGFLGLLGATLIGGAAISAANSANKKKQEEIEREKAQKRARLQQELQNVRYELADKKRGFFRSAWYTQEIENLEARERELIRQINAL